MSVERDLDIYETRDLLERQEELADEYEKINQGTSETELTEKWYQENKSKGWYGVFALFIVWNILALFFHFKQDFSLATLLIPGNILIALASWLLYKPLMNMFGSAWAHKHKDEERQKMSGRLDELSAEYWEIEEQLRRSQVPGKYRNLAYCKLLIRYMEEDQCTLEEAIKTYEREKQQKKKETEERLASYEKLSGREKLRAKLGMGPKKENPRKDK